MGYKYTNPSFEEWISENVCQDCYFKLITESIGKFKPQSKENKEERTKFLDEVKKVLCDKCKQKFELSHEVYKW